ncbi:MAG: hypothetical protein K2M48_05985 [Clostridiales bacterium]|nr:hypothetical protein [Clostridiales bacterium]
MRAAIDIGSNSVRLARSDGKTFSEITKLADGIEATGALSLVGVAATLDVIKRYANMCKDCDRVDVFATEAVRRATDGSAFCAEVLKTSGLTVRILSGEEEAKLALCGAVKPKGKVCVCDLGGGSMELISSRDGVTPEYIKSLPLGVVVLKNRFRGDFRAAIDGAPALVADYGKVPRYPLVVIGGSACAIAAAHLNLNVYDKARIDGATITAAELDGMLPMLMSKDLPVFRPLCAKRADTLPYGAIIIGALLNHLGLDRFTVSDSGNLAAALSGALDQP